MNITIITDASHCHRTLAAGYGYWIASERGKFGGGNALRGHIATSTLAEMMSLVNAVYIAVAKGIVLKSDHILLQNDCEAALHALDGSRKKLSNKERKVRKSLYKLKNEVGFTLSFRHVKGHTGLAEARYVTNELCDRRAKAGLQKAREALNGTV